MLTIINRISVLVFLCALIAFGCNRNKKEHSSEYLTIKSLSTNLKNCIEKEDFQNISSFFTDDAQLLNVTTLEQRQGKEAVASYFTDLKGKEIVVSSKGVRVVSANDAIERGSARLLQKGMPSQKFVWKADYKKSDGVWKVYKLILLSLHKPFSNFEKLKGLSWLVGKWKCSDGDTTSIASQIRWDRSKNFLIYHFSLSLLGSHEVSGVQIIGWDPLNKQIFSWTYDSKGGFGSGKWLSQDDTWYVQVDYTLNDGRKATVTHIYKKADDKMYTFSSENREIDGVLYPNCGPYTFVRRG